MDCQVHSHFGLSGIDVRGAAARRNARAQACRNTGNAVVQTFDCTQSQCVNRGSNLTALSSRPFAIVSIFRARSSAIITTVWVSN